MMHSIALIGAAVPIVLALAPPIPSPTDPLIGGVNLRGFTPKPTTAAVHPDLRRRQAAGQSPIGYVITLKYHSHWLPADFNLACT
jgi:hypothetical protein